MRCVACTLLLAGFSAAALAGAPGGAGGPAAEPQPDLRVEKAEDTVILTDGTKLVGTILAAGLRAVIMIESGQTTERAIKRAEIESFTYAARGSGEVVGYKTGVPPEQGIPVIVGEGVSDAPPAEAPAPAKPPADPKAKPPKPAADLSKLWELLGGNATPEQIAAALQANPQWAAEIGKILRSGQVPPDGTAAVNRFKGRLLQDPKMRKALDDFGKGGKLHGGRGEGRKRD
jgi:hypothetical protein